MKITNYLMNKSLKLNKLHGLYLKSKYIFLALFALVIVAAFVSSKSAYGSGLVDTIETKIKITNGNQTKTILTTQNTLGAALELSGFALGTNDITNPPSETKLQGGYLSVSVVPAISVLIVDGNQYWIGKSAYSDKVQILAQLKIEIAPEDVVTSELITEPIEDGAVGQKIIIKRAPTFTIVADGTEKVVHSWAKTVGEVITEKGYAMRQNDTVQPSKEATSVGVDVIEITRINYEDIEEIVPIQHKNITQTDYNMYKGQSKVTQNGSNGSKRQSVHVVYMNNVEVSRTVTSTEILSNTIDKITVVGVKPYNAGMWWETLVAAGNQWGVNPADMYSVMTCESGGNPFAGWAYKGLFQYHPDTWHGASKAYPGGQYAGAEISNGTAQIYVTAWKVNKDGGWRAWGCKP